VAVVGGVLLLSAALAYGGGHIVDSRTIERSQAVSRAMGCNRTGFEPRSPLNGWMASFSADVGVVQAAYFSHVVFFTLPSPLWGEGRATHAGRPRIRPRTKSRWKATAMRMGGRLYPGAS